LYSKPLHYKGGVRDDGGLQHAVQTYFGGWGQALAAAGVSVERLGRGRRAVVAATASKQPKTEEKNPAVQTEAERRGRNREEADLRILSIIPPSIAMSSVLLWTSFFDYYGYANAEPPREHDGID
jgi:hypothetical protein